MVQKNNRGSLLIEALLATVILSVSLTLIIQSLSSCLKAMSSNLSRFKIDMLVENKMDLLLSRGKMTESLTQEMTTTKEKQYQYSLEQHSMPKDGNFSGLKEVRFTLKESFLKGEREMTTATYLYDGDETKKE